MPSTDDDEYDELDEEAVGEVIEDDEGADEDEGLADDALSGVAADVSELYAIAGFKVDDVDDCGKSQASDGDSE